jgi:hypothetical protein
VRIASLYSGQCDSLTGSDSESVKPAREFLYYRSVGAKRKDKEHMNKPCKFAVALGIGLVLAPWAKAQAPAAQPEAAPTSAAAIPPDQQPTKEQLARLFEVMRLRKQMQDVMKMLPAMIQQQMQAQRKEMSSKMPGGKSMTPEQQAAADKMMGRYMEKALNILTVDEMLDDMTAIYQRHMSRSDVDAFIAFYGSPAGQHLLDEQPAIMREYMPVVMKRVQERSKTLTDEMTKDMEEFLKSPPPAGPAGGKPVQK